jgi:hypothetical protein
MLTSLPKADDFIKGKGRHAYRVDISYISNIHQLELITKCMYNCKTAAITFIYLAIVSVISKLLNVSICLKS